MFVLLPEYLKDWSILIQGKLIISYIFYIIILLSHLFSALHLSHGIIEKQVLFCSFNVFILMLFLATSSHSSTNNTGPHDRRPLDKVAAQCESLFSHVLNTASG